MSIKNNIFVSIASYRDPETIPTVTDALKKAKNPDNIIFGICLQNDDNSLNIKQLKNLHSKIRLLDYHWKDSQGICWARHQTQTKLFDNEEYYLQLDSHHRFIENWDSWLIDNLNTANTNYEKPIIGGYAPAYNPQQSSLEDRPMQMNCYPSFNSDGDLLFFPKLIKNYVTLRKNNINLIAARFLSGHFIFTKGLFCSECLDDPNLYYRGEELSLSARAYTKGYDFFHPTYSIIWHEYIRKNCVKHWNDHTKQNGFIVTSRDRSIKEKEKVKKLLGLEKSTMNFGKYGLGKSRDLHTYELYSGLNFSKQKIHKYAYNISDRYSFPYIMSEIEWSEGMMREYKIDIDIPKYLIEDISSMMIEYVFISCKDKDGNTIYRKKLTSLNQIKRNFIFTDCMEDAPNKVILSPYYYETGQGNNIEVDNKVKCTI